MSLFDTRTLPKRDKVFPLLNKNDSTLANERKSMKQTKSDKPQYHFIEKPSKNKVLETRLAKKPDTTKKTNTKKNANSKLVGIGKSTDDTTFECNLPYYNLGECFSDYQEPLYPQQRKQRHQQTFKNEKSKIPIPEIIAKRNDYYKYVFRKVKKIVNAFSGLDSTLKKLESKNLDKSIFSVDYIVLFMNGGVTELINTAQTRRLHKILHCIEKKGSEEIVNWMIYDYKKNQRFEQMVRNPQLRYRRRRIYCRRYHSVRYDRYEVNEKLITDTKEFYEKKYTKRLRRHGQKESKRSYSSKKQTKKTQRYNQKFKYVSKPRYRKCTKFHYGDLNNKNFEYEKYLNDTEDKPVDQVSEINERDYEELFDSDSEELFDNIEESVERKHLQRLRKHSQIESKQKSKNSKTIKNSVEITCKRLGMNKLH
ncbi:hypothetical protein QTN25_004048 [Entamoeba marina]